MPTIEQDVIIVLILSVVGLLFYVLRTSGQRERDLVTQKEQLVALLAKYAGALVDLTAEIASISFAQRAMENRLERVESLMTALVGQRGGGIHAENSTLNVGRDMVGGDESKRDEAR